jgi:hypothetical protein
MSSLLYCVKEILFTMCVKYHMLQKVRTLQKITVVPTHLIHSWNSGVPSVMNHVSINFRCEYYLILIRQPDLARFIILSLYFMHYILNCIKLTHGGVVRSACLFISVFIL